MKHLLLTSAVLVAALSLSGAASPCLAEGHSLTVRELSQQGRHLEALDRYDSAGGSTAVLADKLAAAKSAWALGLVDRSRQIWDETFLNKDFQGTERYREMLARAILELQEKNFEISRSFAERGAAELPHSELRSQFWLVIAEALAAQGANSQAEGYYRRAVDEGSGEQKNEATFLLGKCQLQLGLVSDARYTFAGVETSSKFSAATLRQLADIDYSQRNYEGVLTWIKEGREVAPSEFEEPWTGYAMVTALLELGRKADAEKELERLRVRYSDNDPWFALAASAVEATHARGRLKMPEVKKSKAAEEPSDAATR
jgi:tetratricopeptide (TPR) repeat protein